MKKPILGLFMATAFANTQAYSHNNIWTFDRLAQENPAFEEAKKQGFTVIEETPNTITVEESTAAKLQEVFNSSSNSIPTALKWGATATGLAVTYLYGPAALFWGTYYGTSYMLGKLGIAGFTGIAAATKAGLMVANSTVAKSGLIAAGGLIAYYGPEAVMKTGEVALAAGKFAATKSWSLGQSAYSYFWDSQSNQSAALDAKRARHLNAIENRRNLAAAAA